MTVCISGSSVKRLLAWWRRGKGTRKIVEAPPSPTRWVGGTAKTQLATFELVAGHSTADADATDRFTSFTNGIILLLCYVRIIIIKFRNFRIDFNYNAHRIIHLFLFNISFRYSNLLFCIISNKKGIISTCVSEKLVSTTMLLVG